MSNTELKKKAKGLVGFLRERALGLVLHAGVFVLIAAAVISLLNYALRTQVFWTVFKGHFENDQKYQLQGLFLPKQELDQSILVLGDTLFHNDIVGTIPADTSVVKIVNNSYDPDDVGIVFIGLQEGYKFTKNKPCALLIQITPLFLARGKAEGSFQDYKAIRYVYKSYPSAFQSRNSFELVKRVAKVEHTMPTSDADPQRPIRMVGQAQFSDHTLENWGLAFAGVETFARPILAVFDTKGTDWSKEGNLIDATRLQLDALAAEQANFSWIALDDFDTTHIPTCETK